MKRIGVLGTFVRDEIWHPVLGAAQPLRQWGGLAYSLSAFAAACPAGTRIHPLARVGRDLSDSALDFVRTLPGVGSTSGLEVVDEPNNQVELRYRDHAERLERLTGGVRSWSLEELLPHTHDLDALYVNFVAGNELDLETARAVRAELDIPIYADLHSLFLGRPPADGGPREPHRLEQWEEWMACFDYVQVNETELGLIGAPRDDALAILAKLPALGPKVVFTTRGGEGATVAVHPTERDRMGVRGDQDVIHFPLDSPENGDPTGCGDVWGSVAFCGLIAGMGLEQAVRRAHAAAGAKMRTSRIEAVPAAVASALAMPPATI